MFAERYMLIGAKIRYYRTVANLDQGSFAEKVGITPQYLSKLEHGSARPSLDLLFRIADTLQISAGKLVQVEMDDY